MTSSTLTSPKLRNTILVVDDDSEIRAFVSGLLVQSGYAVLMAASGEAAIHQSRDYQGKIHLLLSDIDMPEMTGIQLGAKIYLERPDIEVMLMSGGAAEVFVLPGGWYFLPKPFVPLRLLDNISTILHSRSKCASTGSK